MYFERFGCIECVFMDKMGMFMCGFFMFIVVCLVCLVRNGDEN